MPSLCAMCGRPDDGDTALHVHHHELFGDRWSDSNRRWCAYFHRGVPIPRLSETDRDDEFWVGAPAIDSSCS